MSELFFDFLFFGFPADVFLPDGIVAAIPVDQAVNNAQNSAEKTQKVGEADILIFYSKHRHPFLLPEILVAAA
jgi:hypothetical protein